MAAAIADGIEDFDMTILCGSRTSDGILLKDEIEALAARSGGRRLADKKFGWIHPCASFPMSDIELCVFPTQEQKQIPIIGTVQSRADCAKTEKSKN